jgi:uncharacterized protein
LTYASDIAFTDTVKAIQSRKGSRNTYAKMETGGGWQTEITEDLESFLTTQRSIFLGTSNASGQPYIQHRGGPPGFVRVIDRKTLAFADYRGNRQFISQGNLTDNPKAFIFLIDYLNRTRVKIWGHAKIAENEPEFIAELMCSQDEYKARAEQVLIFYVDAWDRNCPQHIPQRIDREDVDELLKQRDLRIAELEEQVSFLKARNK